MFLMLLLVLCGCTPSNNAFIHKSEQPYYLDCELQNEYIFISFVGTSFLFAICLDISSFLWLYMSSERR